METLYHKLYNKYNNLKKKGFTELDEVNKDQELKFVKYVDAAEEVIKHLQNENERLRSQNDDLKTEVASLRFSNESADYQKLWMEESEKNKVLSEEVERLKNLQREGAFSSHKGSEKRASTLQLVPGTLFDSSSERMTRSKRRKLSETESHHGDHQIDPIRIEPINDLGKETMSIENVATVKQPECCRRTIGRSGDGTGDDNSLNCLFQALVEYLVGMKFSVVTQNEGLCISAEHQSSGYSFSLTWLEKADGKEVELKYHVLSLGTFERVAPPWMKETIMFGTTMCPIFFDKVSRVVKSS